MWREQIREKRYGEFFLPFCEKALELWDERKYKFSFTLNEAILAGCCYERLKELPLRTLIHEMHRAYEGGKLKGETDKEKYEYYKKIFLINPEYLEGLQLKYPELFRLLKLRSEQTVENIEELVIRLEKDQGEIIERLCSGETFYGIRSLDMGGADSHNRGKAVTKIVLDQGSRIIYKPHGLKKEVQYQKLLRKLYKELGMYTLELPYIHRDNYGWELWLDHSTCHNVGQIQRYFRRVGVHLFLAYLLSATDLHGENLMAVGEFPVILDMETFPGMCCFERKANADTKVQETIQRSVLRTGILPSGSWAGIGVNAIHPAKEQVTALKMPVVELDKTVKMRIGYRQVRVNLQNSLPLLNGREVDPYHYREMVCDSFSQAYSVWLEEKEEMLYYLLPFYEEKFRIVRRNTQQYAVFLSASLHPAYLSSYQKRRVFLEKLREQNKTENALDQKLEEYEIAALIDMDIPVFYGEGRRRSILSGDGKEYTDYFEDRPDQAFQKGINSFNKTDCELQKILIRLSFEKLRPEKRRLPHRSLKKEERLLQEKANTQINKIAEYLLDTAVFDRNGVPSWMGIRMQSRGEWDCKPIGFDLYDGIPGIAIFLEKLAVVRAEEKYDELLTLVRKKLFRYSENQILGPQISTTGAMTGISSNIYTYLLLYDITGKREYLDYARLHAEILEACYAEDKAFDFLSGNAGAIYVLGKLYETTKEKKFLDLSVYMGDWLWKRAEETPYGAGWRIGENQIPLTGMAHGNSGFLLAYGELLKNTDKGKYERIIEDLLSYENHFFSEQSGNWLDLRGCSEIENYSPKTQNTWCHGAPGILLSRLFLSKLSNFQKNKQIKEDISRAVKSMCIDQLTPGMCICHGKCGNWMILNHFQNVYAKTANTYPCVHEKKRKLEMEIMQTLQENIWSPLAEKYHPGFMSGISGIGYVLLELTEQNEADVSLGDKIS